MAESSTQTDAKDTSWLSAKVSSDRRHGGQQEVLFEFSLPKTADDAGWNVELLLTHEAEEKPRMKIQTSDDCVFIKTRARKLTVAGAAKHKHQQTQTATLVVEIPQ